jgi:murein DD-endopeptidase MepM/ murein hydrolase activator NlpD
MDREFARSSLQAAAPSATLRVPATDQPDAFACSPLTGIIIEALDEIISNPYQPSRQGKDDGHPALDFAFYNWQSLKDIQGHPVQSILKGSVVGLGFDRLPYGNMIIIETEWQDIPAAARIASGVRPDQSLYVLYAHLLETPTANLGEEVACGQHIGSAGKTGNSGAPHLHLEARYGPGGTVFSQMVFYDTQAQEVEMDQYRLWAMSGNFLSVDPLAIFFPHSD